MISPVSENALLITLAREIQPDLPGQLSSLCKRLDKQRWPWLVDLVPAYTTLLVIYDQQQLDFRQAIAAIRPFLGPELFNIERTIEAGTTDPLELPVYYSAESGPDLQALAEARSISTDQVIQQHTADTYQVFALGFAPGFAFMGEVNESIAHPRHQTPRKQVPAGSVGIADRQTAVYPVSSPGGWQIIGRCPTRLFDRNRLSLLAIGDRVSFRSISRQQYLQLGGEL